MKESTERFSTDMRSRQEPIGSWSCKLICGPLFSFQIIKLYLAYFSGFSPALSLNFTKDSVIL